MNMRSLALALAILASYSCKNNSLLAGQAFNDPYPGQRDSDTARKGPVTFTLDATVRTPISPYVYGANIIGTFKGIQDDSGIQFYRQGGNRFSAYNWETNYSHAGSDYHYQNDLWLCGLYLTQCQNPGDVVKAFMDSAFRSTDALLLTVPMLDYVALKKSGGDVCRNRPDKKWECTNRKHWNLLFRRNLATKPAKVKLSLKPDLSDGFVYQDEFINWVNNEKKGHKGKKIFYSLDNEPGLWAETHKRIRPYGKHCVRSATYPELMEKSLKYAKMIKKMAGNTLIFGPAHYGFNSLTTLQNVKWCHGHKEDFADFYLKSLARAKLQNGSRHLVDVWDLHWYPEIRSHGKSGNRITGGATDAKTVVARVQAPRSLWQKDFQERTWITNDALGQPLRLIPRLQNKVAELNPGMKLAITEYNYGGEHHISGGIAQAEVLGVYGREGLFAAAFWSMGDEKLGSAFIKGAFKLYGNYDGRGSKYGNQALSAATNGISRSTVFASTYKGQPGKMMIIAINKTTGPLTAKFKTKGVKLGQKARGFRIDADNASPKAIGIVDIGKSQQISLPPMSVTALVYGK